MEVLIGLGIIGLAIFVIAKISAWVLGPLDHAARNRRYPPQFTLADFLCLFVQIQLGMAAVHSIRFGPGETVVLDIFAGLACTALWWTAVGTLSRAGIHRVWQRSVCLALVIPATVVAAIAAPVLPFIAFFMLCEPRTVHVGFMLLAIEVGAGALIYGMGRFTRAAVAQGEPAAAREEPAAPPEG